MNLKKVFFKADNKYKNLDVACQRLSLISLLFERKFFNNTFEGLLDYLRLQSLKTGKSLPIERIYRSIRKSSLYH